MTTKDVKEGLKIDLHRMSAKIIEAIDELSQDQMVLLQKQQRDDHELLGDVCRDLRSIGKELTECRKWVESSLDAIEEQEG